MIVNKEDDNIFRVTAKIKWFNQFKGYGFVETENIEEDIFLHFSVIDQSGIQRLNNEDIIVCDISKSNKGYHVIHILEVLHSNKYETPGIKPEKTTAIMKWFNPAKGFGFAQLRSGEDVFIHSNLLKKYRIDKIYPGQTISILIHHTNFGYEALDLVIHDNESKA